MKQSYLPAVDGLRFLAVTAVIVNHYPHPHVTAGWTGVWLFFCISGFVITRSLAQIEITTRSTLSALLVFYTKRVFRIWPAYVLVVAVASPFLILSHAFPPLEALSLATFTNNAYQVIAYPHMTHAFQHLWSLSAEEQFYVAYPIAFLAFSSRRMRTAVLLIGILTAPLIRDGVGDLVLSTTQNVRKAELAVYFTPICQADAFALGGLLALHEQTIRRVEFLAPLAWIVAAGGATSYVVWQWLADPEIRAALTTLNPLHVLDICFQMPLRRHLREITCYCVVDLGAVALLVSAITMRTPFSRLMAWRPVAYCGRISYGVYLLHMPLLAALEFAAPLASTPRWTYLALFAPYVLVTFAGAALMNRMFERPWQSAGARMLARFKTTDETRETPTAPLRGGALTSVALS